MSEDENVPPNGPFRGSAAPRAPLLFGATSVCAECALRFQRRSACPECGGEETISLASREGRATYAYRLRRRAAAGSGALAGLAPWAPSRTGLTLAVGVALVLPALVARLVWGPNAFLRAWVMSDLSIRYDGLSRSGLSILGLAAVGVLLVVFTLLARAGLAQATRTATTPRPRMRVHAPEPADEDVIHGIARAGTIEIESAIGKVPCLAFGLRGSTDRADIADAEGGDFDVELPSGERVLVSLEHAVLVVGEERAPARPVTARVAVEDALEELLESRGITTKPDVPIPVEEVVLRDGDTVTVSGIKVGASIALAGGGRARVLAGDASRPLAVRIS